MWDIRIHISTCTSSAISRSGLPRCHTLSLRSRPALRLDWALQDRSTSEYTYETLSVPIFQAGGFAAGQLGFSRGIPSDSSSNCDNQVIITPTSRKKPVERGSGENLTCDHDGCSYKGAFPRQWKLQRHIASKHTTEKPYWCPVVGCVKGNGAPAFARPDKLTAHVRAVHYGTDVKAICPANTCTDKALTLDLLGVHVKSEHLKNRN